MGIKFQNNASTTIPLATTIGATSIAVDAGTGAEFPVLGAGDYFYATIHDPTSPALFEIVKVTARSGDTLTIVRGQEGTTAKAWPVDTHIEQRITAATILDALNERLLATDYTAADVLAKLLTVDGAGSGLDADTLDGQTGSYYTAIASRLGYTPLNQGGDTLGGDLNFGGNRAKQPRLEAYRESVTSNAAATGTITLDLSTANVFNLTLTGSGTLAFSNPPASGLMFSITVIVKQDATGNRTLSYPASVKWSDGITPVLATAANKVDVLTFFTVDGGTTYYGAQALANM